MKGQEDRSIDGAEIRRQAEEAVRDNPIYAQEDSVLLSPEEIRRTFHELRVHQVELEMQNEELRRAQLELDAARERYFDLYDLAPVSYVTVSEKGLVIEANLTAASLLGVARSALVQRPLAQFIFREDQEQYYLHRKRLLDTGEPQAFELRMQKSDGTLCWARLTATATEHANGAPLCRVAFSDITEHKLLEEANSQTQARTSAILESISDAFLSMNNHMVITYFNRAAEVALRRNSGEVIGQQLFDAFPEARGSIFEAQYTRALAEQIQLHFETCFGNFPHEDWYHIRVYPHPDGISVFFQIITERKRAEEALLHANERLSLAQRTARAGVWDWDIPGQRLTCTQEFCALIGLEPDMAPTFEAWRGVVHPEDRLEVEARINEAVQKHVPLASEYRIVQPSGEVRWINALGDTLYAEDGTAKRMAGICIDITERKRAEEERSRLEVQLQQAQKMESVGRLAGGIAHDFNNMLQVILLNAETAMSACLPGSPLGENLLEIVKSAQRSAGLTQQLLAYARRQTIAPKVLDLNNTITSILKMLRPLIGENIDLCWQPGPNLWAIHMDPSQMDRLLANLCVNARDAISGIGKITVSTGNRIIDDYYCLSHPGCVVGEYVWLSVSDSGCGVPPETLPYLFEPFFTTKDIGQGTGLGLATVYGIVTQNKGFITVYTEPGQGTTFSIYLPRHSGRAEEKRMAGAIKRIAGGLETILLVEDEPALLMAATTLLQGAGYTVLSAITPGDAIRLAREYEGAIHLLVTDVILPEMNGRDVARNLQNLYPNIKSLFVSGYSADIIATEGMLEPGLNFLQKPFSADDLAVKIRKVLDRA